MTVGEIKNRVMFQTNNDRDDIGDFEPYLLQYVNEGYNKMLSAVVGGHVGDTDYPLLEVDTDELSADIPAWAHGALADYATYRIYLNGNAPKQNRAFLYLSNFNRTMSELVASETPAITSIPD